LAVLNNEGSNNGDNKGDNKGDAMRIIYKASADQIGVSLHHRTVLNIQLGKCIADLIGSTPSGGVGPLTNKAPYNL
jgi:hypothetical protein